LAHLAKKLLKSEWQADRHAQMYLDLKKKIALCDLIIHRARSNTFKNSFLNIFSVCNVIFQLVNHSTISRYTLSVTMITSKRILKSIIRATFELNAIAGAD